MRSLDLASASAPWYLVPLGGGCEAWTGGEAEPRREIQGPECLRERWQVSAQTTWWCLLLGPVGPDYPTSLNWVPRLWNGVKKSCLKDFMDWVRAWMLCAATGPGNFKPTFETWPWCSGMKWWWSGRCWWFKWDLKLEEESNPPIDYRHLRRLFWITGKLKLHWCKRWSIETQRRA